MIVAMMMVAMVMWERYGQQGNDVHSKTYQDGIEMSNARSSHTTLTPTRRTRTKSRRHVYITHTTLKRPGKRTQALES